jgi:hypothetical protein
MSGNSGDRDDTNRGNQPTGSGGGGGSGGQSDPCQIVAPAPLNSPKPSVVATLVPGQILDVFLNTGGQRPVLEVRTATGAVAGSLTHVGHLTLIGCMQQGWAYQAVVLSVSGGAVMVRVEPA